MLLDVFAAFVRLRLLGPRASNLLLLQVERVFLEGFEGHVVERPLVGCCEDHGRRHSGTQRFAPARGAQAPAVAGIQPREAKVGHRRAEGVTACDREFQEFLCDLNAYDMRPVIFRPGVAAAVAEETGHRIVAAIGERPAEHVTGAITRPGGWIEGHGPRYFARTNFMVPPSAGRSRNRFSPLTRWPIAVSNTF